MRIWNPWQSFTLRKLFSTLLIVVVLGTCLALYIYWTLEHSEPYKIGAQAVAGKLSVPVESVRLKRFGDIDYVEGDSTGSANFVLCTPSERCFTVMAKKRDAVWKVVELQEER